MSNEKEIEKQEKVKMPWQGFILFFLIFINIISLIVIFIGKVFWLGNVNEFDFFEKIIDSYIVLFNFLNDKIFIFNSENIIGIFYFLIYILSLAILINVLEKKRWAIYLFIFQNLFYILILIFFPELLFNFKSYEKIKILYLIINFFILYLSISYLKYLYYLQKNNSVKI